MKLIQQHTFLRQKGTSEQFYEIGIYQFMEDSCKVYARHGYLGYDPKKESLTTQPISLERAEIIIIRYREKLLKRGYHQLPPSESSMLFSSTLTGRTESVRKSILRRLQDEIEGVNSFHTQRKITRVIRRAGMLGIREAVPYLLKLTSPENELQTYCVILALHQLKAEEGIPLLQKIAFDSGQKAYLRHTSCEALLHLLTGEELLVTIRRLQSQLHDTLKEAIIKNDFQLLADIMTGNPSHKQVSNLTTLYLLAAVCPPLLPVLHTILKKWVPQPPCFRQFRSVYRLAKIRKDYPTLALLCYRFEREPAMFTRSKRTFADQQTQYIPYLKSQVTINEELRKEKSRLAFSHYTKNYLQKDARNTLYALAAEGNVKGYIGFATSLLLQYKEDDYSRAHEKPANSGYDISRGSRYEVIDCPECHNLLLLSTILFSADPRRILDPKLGYIYGRYYLKRSGRFHKPYHSYDPSAYKNSGIYRNVSFWDRLKGLFYEQPYQKEPETDEEPAEASEFSLNKELQRWEIYPEFWDQMPEAYIRLLMQSEMKLIHKFAYERLRRHPSFTTICEEFSETYLLELLQNQAELPNRLGTEILLHKSREFNYSPGFLAKALISSSSTAKAHIRQLIDRNRALYIHDMEFVCQLLFSPKEEDESNWISDLFRDQNFSGERQQALVGKMIAYLLCVENRDSNNSQAKYMIEQVERMAPSYMEQLSWEVVEQLITSELPVNTWLASHITLKKARHGDPLEIPLALTELFLRTSPEDVRRKGIELLDIYPDHFFITHFRFLQEQTDTPYQEVAYAALKKMTDLIGYNRRLAQEVLDTLIKRLIHKEKFEGAHKLFRNCMIDTLKHHSGPSLTFREIYRLLQAPHREAQLLGYELLIGYALPAETSLSQLLSLGNHELIAVRQWCQEYLRKNPSRVCRQKEMIILLESPWEDTRKQAFQLFRNEGREQEPDIYFLLQLIASSRTEVRDLGKELAQRLFRPGQAHEYLIALSQHPSPHVQAFLTGQLETYASGRIDIIRELEFFFRTVLYQVNKGRIAKQNVYEFIRKEALKDPDIAAFFIPLLDQVATQITHRDQAAAIHLLTKIKEAHPQLTMQLIFKDEPHAH